MELVLEKYEEALKYFNNYDFISAEKIFKELINEKQNIFDSLNFIGIIKLRKGEFKEASDYLRKALEINPSHSITLYNLGLSYQYSFDYLKAEEQYKRLLQIEPHIDALNNLGIIKLHYNDLDEAENYFKQTLKLNPSYEEAFINLGNLKLKQEKYNEAISYYNKVTNISVSLLNNILTLANTFLNNEEHANALKYFELALKLENRVEVQKLKNNSVTDNADLTITDQSNKFAIYTNLGILKMYSGKIIDAVEAWKKALEINPESPEANYNLGHANLLLGNFDDGWKGYEWRKKRSGFKLQSFNVPELAEQNINGKTIFVYDEQGLGDAIQFLRYLHLLKSKGAKIIFKYDSRLMQIFKNIKWIDIHTNEKSNIAGLQFDFHISLQSLPLYFKTNLNNIPSNIPYIFADDNIVKQLAPIIKRNNKFNIGIVWAGNPNHTNDKRRSCRLKYFEKIISLNEVQIFSLQKGSALNQLRETNLPVIDLDSKGLETFQQTAAVVENLDLVITVDTSVAHLAGAMGKPVWVILPFLPDWRWMLDRNDTPWYPSMKLFRQKLSGDWENVFDDVIKNLIIEVAEHNTKNAVVV